MYAVWPADATGWRFLIIYVTTSVLGETEAGACVIDVLIVTWVGYHSIGDCSTDIHTFLIKGRC